MRNPHHHPDCPHSQCAEYRHVHVKGFECWDRHVGYPCICQAIASALLRSLRSDP